jgi:steroid delta-isomerase-like uncharacterized protein
MTMATNPGKEIIERWWAALSDGTAAAIIDETYTADYLMHDPSQPEPVRGLEGVRAFIAAVTSAFPDGHYTIEELLVEGDRVFHRIIARATHQGEFMGVPASGRPVEIWLMVVSRIADGKIAEEWQLVDSLTLLQQIGAIPMAD